MKDKIEAKNIKFKTPRQEAEWERLDPLLQKILLDISSRTFLRYRHGITTTEILRTQAEQDTIYLNHIDPEVAKKYKEKPWPSTHQFYRGTDMRIDFPAMWLKGLVDYVNENYPYDPERPKLKTAVVHNAGSGEHIHLQVRPA